MYALCYWCVPGDASVCFVDLGSVLVVFCLALLVVSIAILAFLCLFRNGSSVLWSADSVCAADATLLRWSCELFAMAVQTQRGWTL